MNLKVLVVEDEELVRNEIVLTTPWARFSCEVIASADNGLVGENLIRTLQPDIVITDIRMPGQDGIEMLKKITPPAALILTGHSDFNYARQALRLGVKDFIIKPVDDEEFYAALDRVSKELIAINADSQRIETSSVAPPPYSSFREYVKPEEGDKQDFYVGKAIEYIGENYRNDISLRDAAEKIGITESYLSRLFRIKTNYSFLEYLRFLRLKKALELLRDKGKRINEIGRETGFRDMSYFSRIFRKYIGVSPRVYQNGLKQKSAHPSKEKKSPVL
ncbi:MAG: response regulator [Spirochaetales bacterium]|nr:response regulator [Spirochaetales bacterium]